jgi:hypothetical protein
MLELLNAGPFAVVRVGSRDEDQYGRKLRVVLRDRHSLGMILVSEGLARRWSGSGAGKGSGVDTKQRQPALRAPYVCAAKRANGARAAATERSKYQCLATKSVIIAAKPAILKEAIAADPSYARAWINLAWAHSSAASYGSDWGASTRAALEAAERAVALDPNDAEAHAVLGHMLGLQGDFGRAKTEFDAALRLNPGSVGSSPITLDGQVP